MSAKLKKTVGFLVCRDAFTQRNITSIGLVALFILTYILAGGKIGTKLPKFDHKGGLVASGTSDKDVDAKKEVLQEINDAEQVPDLTIRESESVLGVRDSDDRQARDKTRAKMGSLFSEDEREEGEVEPVNKDGLVKGAEFVNRREQFLLEQSEKKPQDSLSVIEERLQMKKRR